jgi:uncharacterized protein (DUF2141 family)
MFEAATPHPVPLPRGEGALDRGCSLLSLSGGEGWGDEVRRSFMVAALAAATLLTAGGQAFAAADLKVEVSGLRNYKGRVVVVLWAAADQTSHFPDHGRVQHRDENPNDMRCDFSKASVCRRTIESLQNLTVSYTFRDVPEGDYAVFGFHDENNNGVLDTGLMGRPLEARGYSQVLPDDVSPLGARISFYRARFSLPAPKTVVVGLRYPPFRPR